MKRLIITAKRKSSILIIGLLLAANLFAFGLASHYLKDQTVSSVQQADQEQVTKAGWQVLGWGYSLLESIRIAPQQ
ncbi:MAG: hypothetical protein ACI9JN_002773 [Bacteroidia bacterium]|jgi:hypothetical protein